MKELDVKNKKSIYVIGFPKSGNTWLARLLAEVTASKMEASNVVDGADNSEGREGKYLICKAHDSIRNILPDDVPVVYIIRDIRDVLVSAFFFNNRFVCEDIVRLDSKNKGLMSFLYKVYFHHQIKRMNKRWCGNEWSVIMNWIYGRKNTVGSWSEHIESWIEDSRVVVIKYEDLLCDTDSELRKILGFLEIDVSDEILEEAISNQSFKNKKTKFMEAGNIHNVNFLRSGKAEGWREFFSPLLVEKIEKTHAEVMKKFDYQLEYYEGEK